jgi:uncharacterized damage-inducible protein DinB
LGFAPHDATEFPFTSGSQRFEVGMPSAPRHVIEPSPGYAVAEVASFVAQLEDQSRRLRADTRELGPDALEWQPAPGQNTIGMLLAHIAIVEVFWTCIVLEDQPRDADPFPAALGIGGDDDGLPLSPGGLPPAALAGRDLAFYDDLLDRARAYLERAARTLRPDDLTRVVEKPRPNGDRPSYNARWALYHMLEHFAGHYGQILLLRHQWRDRATR